MPDTTGSGPHDPGDHQDHPASDEQLLRAVREGDSAAFGELFERHRGAVLAVARMHARNEADAQDLTSEAFTRALGLLREGKGPQQFLRAYLVTAVSRLAADRANDLTRTRPEDPQPEGALDRVEFFDDIVVKQVDSAVVARAFATLPERWQEILWYLEIEGRRPRQVATALGVQPNTVSALGKRAREGLRTAYVQEHVSAQALEDCQRYSSQLGAFTRGSLTPSRTKMVQEHLDDCRRCTAEYLQLQDLGIGLRGWVLPVLAGLPLWGDLGGRLAGALGALPALGGQSAAAAGATVHHGAGTTGSADPGVTQTGAQGAGTTSAGSGTSASAAATTAAGGSLSTAGIAAAVASVLVLGASAAGIAALTAGQDRPAPSAVGATSASPTPGLGADQTGPSSPRTTDRSTSQPQPQETALPAPFQPGSVQVAPSHDPAPPLSLPEAAPARATPDDAATPGQPGRHRGSANPAPASSSAPPEGPRFTLIPTPSTDPYRPLPVPSGPTPSGRPSPSTSTTRPPEPTRSPEPTPTPSVPEPTPTRGVLPVPAPSEPPCVELPVPDGTILCIYGEDS